MIDVRWDDDEYFFKFDGQESKWDEWSGKTLSLAKIKGFRAVYTNDTKPCSDDEYAASNDAEEKKIYELNDKAYHLLIMSCSGIAFWLVHQAKTKRLMDGDAYLAWKNLCSRYEPSGFSDLLRLIAQFNNCSLESTKSDPDEWFVELHFIQQKITKIDPTLKKQDAQVILHILSNLPDEYGDRITVQDITEISLTDLKAEIRALYRKSNSH